MSAARSSCLLQAVQARQLGGAPSHHFQRTPPIFKYLLMQIYIESFDLLNG